MQLPMLCYNEEYNFLNITYKEKNMSAFLGPIHFWLYNKIGKQEALTKIMADYAAKEGSIADASTYTKDLPALEDVIDEGNIHGWLQGQITDAESRYANLVTTILKVQPEKLEDLKALAFEFGKENTLKNSPDTTVVYREFENFFVNGMPCDHVNNVTETEHNIFAWEQTADLHRDCWIEKGGDPANYYILRKSVMDGMLDGSEFSIEMPDTDHYILHGKS